MKRKYTKTDFAVLLLIALALFMLGGPKEAKPAEAVELKGAFVQGGLVVGRAAAGSRVTLDGRPVKVRSNGRFLIGFGREAKAKARLEVRLPGGEAVIRTIAVKKRRYRVQRIDGLPPKMVTPPPRVLKRIRAEARRIKQARRADTDLAFFDSGFIWPAHGRVSGVYGSQRILNGKPRRPHYGVDIAAPVGTQVLAAAAGIVRIADTDMYYTGGTVLIDHGYGLNSVYSHLKRVTVKVGDKVRKGAKIGTVGATGRVTGAHLDWRVNLFLTRLDPALLVPPMAD